MREPTKGSLATLNANAEKGSSSDAFLISSSSLPGMLPVACCTSLGSGIKFTMASRSGCTPLFLNALPVKIGTNSKLIVPFLIQRLRVSSSGSSPSKYFSKTSSSCSTAISTISDRYFSAVSFNSSGISVYSYLAPRSSFAQTIALFFTRSITPFKSDSLP